LLSYGPGGVETYHRVSYFVDRLFKVAKPSDLPVDQTAAFKLAVNLKTAEALGLTIPESILLRAAKVLVAVGCCIWH
jgi:putative ABC transport system substrate-binding protein